MVQIKVNSVNTTHGNVEFEQTSTFVSDLERHIINHTDSKGNLKPKSVTLSPKHIGKTITCKGCKDNIHYGKPFVNYGESAYCSKKCCSNHICDGDNDRLFDVEPYKSLEEYDREFLRYYYKE